MEKGIKVLFVCLGNICRSPTAEAIMNHLVQKAGLEGKILCDSAGTSDAHAGERANATMRHYAETKGYTMTSLSRPVDLQDFQEFDFIVTMDSMNYRDVMSRAGGDQKNQKKILKISDFNSENSDIPDPYQGGKEGFLKVIALLEESCSQLLQKLKKQISSSG